MQCEEFEDRLNAVLDERQRPEVDAELALHCETCAECRQLAADYGAMMNGFFALMAREATSNMASRVMAELNPQTVVRRPRRRTAALALGGLALATAASLLVAVPLLRSPEIDGTPVAQVPPQTETVRETIVPPATAQVKAEDTQTAQAALAERMPVVRDMLTIPTGETMPGGEKDPYSQMARGAGKGLASFVMALPGNSGRKRILAPNSPPEPPSAIEVVEEALNPITDTVSATFTLLLRSIPGGSAG